MDEYINLVPSNEGSGSVTIIPSAGLYKTVDLILPSCTEILTNSLFQPVFGFHISELFWKLEGAIPNSPLMAVRAFSPKCRWIATIFFPAKRGLASRFLSSFFNNWIACFSAFLSCLFSPSIRACRFASNSCMVFSQSASA